MKREEKHAFSKKKMTALKSEVWQSNTCLILLCKVVSSGVLQNWPLHGNNGQGSLTEWFKDFNIWSFHNCILHHVKEFFTVLTLIILGMWLLKLVIQLWHKRMCIKRKLCTKLWLWLDHKWCRMTGWIDIFVKLDLYRILGP